MTKALAHVGLQSKPCGSDIRLVEPQIGTSRFATPDVLSSWPHGLRMPSEHAPRVRSYGNAIRPRGTPPV